MNILHIDCSPRSPSHSRRLSAAVVARLLEAHSSATVTRRDLGIAPIPHVTSNYAAAIASPASLASAPGSAFRLSEELIGEVEAADIIVIGTPMNNFTVPSVLKAWLDQIVRIGRTFTADLNGKIGLLKDCPVIVALASGGIFTGDRANQPDFLTPYLKAVLGCIGLKSLHFMPVQATAFLNETESLTAQDRILATFDPRSIEMKSVDVF